MDCAKAARRTALLLVLGLATGASRTVTGDPGPGTVPARPALPVAELHYARHAGAENCPDEPTLRKAVSARMGRDPFLSAASTPVAPLPSPAPTPARPSLRLTVAVQPARRGLQARIDLQDARGRVVATRRLGSPASDCNELGAALALALALAIDPFGPFEPVARSGASGASSPPSDAAGRSGGGGSSSPPQTVPTKPPAYAYGPPSGPLPQPNFAVVDPPERRPPPLPAPAPPPRRPGVRFRGGLELHAAVGTAPTAAFGGTLVAGARWRYASLNAEARADVPSSARVGTDRVSTWLATGTLAPCGHVSFFTGCALVGLGPITISATGLGEPRRVVDLLVQVGARGAVELPLTRALHLLLHADVLVALTRPHLTVADMGNGAPPEREIFRTPRVSGTLGAGLLFYVGR